MPAPRPTPRTLSQNFLIDRPTIAHTVRLLGAPGAHPDRPVVEVGAGDGALTLPLARLGRPLTALEIDPRRARRLAARVPEHVEVVTVDATRFAYPRDEFTLVGNLPFHLTTPLLRRFLHLPSWDRAVLLVQWEVARKRAGLGGSTLLTAQSAPWFETELVRRVPAAAFRPRPRVDAGLLLLTRRAEPLVSPGERPAYARFVQAVFTGPGRGLPDVLARTGVVPRDALREWLADQGLGQRHLPRDLGPREWAALWRLVRPGSS